jgi:hypothetical protein
MTVIEYRVDVTLATVDYKKSVEVAELMTVRWEKGLTGAKYEGLPEKITGNLRKQDAVEGDLWEATQRIVVLHANGGRPVPEA